MLTGARERQFPSRVSREHFDAQPQSVSQRLQSQRDFLRVADLLCPPKESFLNKATVRHPEFHPSELFVSDSLDIECVIDWQHSTVLPLFLQAGIPNYLQNWDDSTSLTLEEPPTLPADYDTLDETSQAAARRVYRDRHDHYSYLAASLKHNLPHFSALQSDPYMLRQDLFRHASKPWDGDSVTLKALLIRLAKDWRGLNDKLAATVCPLSYAGDEMSACLELHGKLEEDGYYVSGLHRAFGMARDGWVPSEPTRGPSNSSGRVEKSFSNLHKQMSKDRCTLELGHSMTTTRTSDVRSKESRRAGLAKYWDSLVRGTQSTLSPETMTTKFLSSQVDAELRQELVA
jgi:hypothetical protein